MRFLQAGVRLFKNGHVGGLRNFSGAAERSQLKWGPIGKLLVANRGEIACRIFRSAKRLGMRTVAIYSEADKDALHVRLADEAFCVGPAPSQQSYLDFSRILNVAKTSGADAVHPGYGFLSENMEFAELCQQEGIIFVGPPSSAIRDMGIKSTAKAIMERANVPVVLGYHAADQSDAKLKSEAERIGYPVMLKAVRGGGGKGMRIALSPLEFDEQLESARREALKSFGNDEMILEKYVENPRHIEVQIFGDHHDNHVYLYERDCSVQRRHQKVIEEAPAPNISEETRHSIGKAAVMAAKAVGYVGAGTVEFIVDANHNFYFMEMNTRLQVEHPVTEMVTGTDLVEWQLKVAQGEHLPLKQGEIRRNGHAFEARIYAEDPDNNFMPGAGPLVYLRTPQAAEDVRIETGVVEGDEVSVYYDPMIAKLVVWAPDRLAALRRLDKALGDYHIVGLKTNIRFLRSLANHHQFQLGNVNTNFIPDHFKELFPPKTAATELSGSTVCQLVVGQLLLRQHQQSRRLGSMNRRSDPFVAADNFRLNMPFHEKLKFEFPSSSSQDSRHHPIEVFLTQEHCHSIHLVLGDQNYSVSVGSASFDNQSVSFQCTINGKETVRAKLVAAHHGTELHLFGGDSCHRVLNVPQPKWLKEGSGASAGSSGAVAPMPGVVEKVLVSAGQTVEQNDPLIIIIAMKMEYIIRAPDKAQVDKVLCQVGQSVSKGAQLVQFHLTEDV